MIIAEPAQLTTLSLIAMLLTLAALGEVQRVPIAGRLCLAGVVLYPVHVLGAAATIDWRGGLLAAAIVLGVGAVPVARRWVARAELEMLALTALWAGTSLLAPLLLIVLVTPGLTSFGLRARGRFARSCAWAEAGVLAIGGESAAAVPNSVAILAGGLVVVALRLAGAG